MFKKVQQTKHQVDWTRKESPSPHNNQNTKHTGQRKILKAARKKTK